MTGDTRLRALVWLSAGGVAALGSAMLAGGLWLAAVGGSRYYVVAGAAMLSAAVLLARRRPLALMVYAAVVLGTLAWAVLEVGLDWWQLAPRGDLMVPIGIYLLLLGAILRRAGAPAATWRRAQGALAASLALAAVVGTMALLRDTHDRAGNLPEAPPGVRAPIDGGVAEGDWRAYGRTSYGDRYSPLRQITSANVGNLEIAWTFRTGDLSGPGDPVSTTDEATPLEIDDTLYLCTPHDHLIALDAETGRQRWRYDPRLVLAPDLRQLHCRGVSYYESAAGADGPCRRRLFLPTADARLIAVDADDGRPCRGFGKDGTVDLWVGMPRAHPGYYYATSPPLVTHGLVVVGGNVSDDVSTIEPSGVLRAYDAVTGRLVWNWDSGNPDATGPLPAGQRYTPSSPNSWSVASADEALGLIYLPMGNQTPDEWGGDRPPGAERFSSSIVALDATTGKLRWVFQTVHHDLWDMDVASQPSLVDLRTPEGVVPALVAPTKRGDLYVLDRRTGTTIVPAPERPVPQGAAAGDRTSPTQPFSQLTFAPPTLTERDMWGATMLDQLYCRILFRKRRYEGIFTPPSTRGTLVYPGNLGVFNWGGIAIDPVRQVAFGSPSYIGFIASLTPWERGPDSPFAKTDNPLANPQHGAPFAVRLHAFLSPLGLPCQAPPWGYVAGVDLATARIVWQHRNGTVRDSSPLPLRLEMGVPSMGGPILTAGGVAFLTGTLDDYVRAYEVTTGRQLWQARLPAGGQATPITYRSEESGRQFLLVVAGGHGSLGTRLGDWVIAYALPKS
jgi:quinoprotein glucose dehydrogenase